ncbi:hypothetical protein D9T17_00055 [Lysobacter enzymogenes]|uniref:Uncharacterized protein n=1 Tax=Lysobacter enzymogenes TaxID=69 RepID=A0A3N2RPH8_LYSEN|nr:hypothetical protein D9T17_00055 [Lysobacter enzymogenes]
MRKPRVRSPPKDGRRPTPLRRPRARCPAPRCRRRARRSSAASPPCRRAPTPATPAPRPGCIAISANAAGSCAWSATCGAIPTK